MRFLILFFLVLNGCFLINYSSYINIQDDYTVFLKDDKITAAIYKNGKKMAVIVDSIYESMFGQDRSDIYKNFSDLDFYQLNVIDSVYEISLRNSDADSILIFRNDTLYKKVKLVYSNQSFEIIEAFVYEKNSRIPKKIEIKQLGYDWLIDLRKKKK